ncbi:hypothetical protein SDC9_04033 [bioreactor metagenome]|uniref:Membrane protein YkvI n=1 Tax=bioreactor metagenome TaxID=1076179 RepID=A0A644SUX2_9ZZZZ|nr:hypothetical protein [Negativicutes bacterium]
MTKKFIDVFRVAATYVGTVIGAGFASGQEIVQFFISYGNIGLVGILLAGLLFAWLGSYIINLGHRLNATGYQQVLYYICGKRIGGVLDVTTGVFLFGGLTIMLAGAGTVSRDFLSLSYNTGLIAMALLVMLTVLTGVRGISIINSLVTPLLVISTIVIGINSILYHGFNPTLLSIPAQPSSTPATHWVMSALLYASYNLILGTTILAPLGSQIASRKVRILGGLIGGLLLTLLGLFVAMIITYHSPEVFQHEVPMLYVSNLQHEFTHAGYAAMLVKAMYSTAMASLYGCSTKLQSAAGLSFPASLVVITLSAVICSQVGFSNLIATVYPIFGYIALIFTVSLIWHFFRGK